jgi:hypothetical protein
MFVYIYIFPDLSRNPRVPGNPGCPRETSSRPEMDMELGGSQSRSGCSGGEKNFLPVPGIELRFLGLLTDSLVTLAQPTWQHKIVRIHDIIQRIHETEFAGLRSD